MPPYTNFISFLIISSKTYASYPKMLMKSATTVIFGRKVFRGSSFKKDSQFNSNLSIANDVLVMLLYKLFVDTVILNSLIL